MSSDNVYFIAVADHMGGAVKHAIMNNQPSNLGMLNQNVKRGLRIFESWLEDHGGRVLLCEGDTVTAELPGENLDSLPQLHSEVQDAWGDSITIGIGLDLKEAYKACENGKKRGGKRIVFYAPEIEQHLNEESASESHDAKNNDGDPEELKELGLNKANSPSPGPPTPNQASFSSGPPASPPSAPSPFAPGQAQPSGADMPPPPSSTNAAQGLSPVEAQMREMAGHGEAEAARAEGQANAADDGTTGPAQLKQGIARILLKVKEQAQVLEQLKEQAPEAYTAILGMVQVIAAIGKQLVPPKGEEEKGEPVKKSYTIEDNSDVRQLRRSYVVEGVQTAPLKNTGINQQINVQDHVFPTNKEEFEPHEAPPAMGRLDKIRKAAMQKHATGDAVTAAPPGLKVQAGVRKEEKKWEPTHCEGPDCPNPPKKGGFLCPDCEKKYPHGPPEDPMEKAALPMPEEGAKTPPKASGSLLSRLRGDSSPQAHKYFHQTPGQAAHVSMDGKVEGKNVVRQFQSGKVLPINARAETDTGQTHPVSALNPTDSEGREKQEDPNQPQA